MLIKITIKSNTQCWEWVEKYEGVYLGGFRGMPVGEWDKCTVYNTLKEAIIPEFLKIKKKILSKDKTQRRIVAARLTLGTVSINSKFEFS